MIDLQCISDRSLLMIAEALEAEAARTLGGDRETLKDMASQFRWEAAWACADAHNRAYMEGIAK